MNPRTTGVALRDIRAARRRIGSAVFTTPCHEAPLLSALAGMELFCKYENLQRTGSFKERGARNALSLLGRDQRKNGVLTASTGSHALGLAYHARQMGVNRAGDHAFAVARGRIDAVVTVSEDELCAAIHALAERAKCVVEGAGAAPLAACLGGRLPELQDKRVVLPLGGGNIDPARLAEVLRAAGCCEIKVGTTGPWWRTGFPTRLI